MLDIFAPVAPQARRENLAAYRQFLAARDGDVDPEARTLSRREARTVNYAKPLSKLRPIDRTLFDRQYADFDPKLETPAEMLLLLTLVKTNAAEAYGVDRTYESIRKRAQRNGDDIELVLLIEESYHTRILLSSSQLYGVDIPTPYSPGAGLMALIGGIAHMPEFISRPLTLAAEILGTSTFLSLLGATGRIFKDDPELRDAIEERIIDVLIDEVGHVSFNRMCLGQAGLTQARALLPLILLGLSGTIPEIAALNLHTAPTNDMLSLAPNAFPDAVRRNAFLA